MSAQSGVRPEDCSKLLTPLIASAMSAIQLATHQRDVKGAHALLESFAAWDKYAKAPSTRITSRPYFWEISAIARHELCAFKTVDGTLIYDPIDSGDLVPLQILPENPTLESLRKRICLMLDSVSVNPDEGRRYWK